jgi:hypothetical protein
MAPSDAPRIHLHIRHRPGKRNTEATNIRPPYGLGRTLQSEWLGDRKRVEPARMVREFPAHGCGTRTCVWAFSMDSIQT